MGSDDDKAQKELGDKFKKAREKAEMSQADVAREAELNTNYYARIERGKENPTFKKLRKIAKTLKIRFL